MNTRIAAFKPAFKVAPRVNDSLTGAAEKRVLLWLAERLPAWVSPDLLTATGLLAQTAAGAGYALARFDRRLLLAVIACIVLNWLGDSLDGTLARVRREERPRYGFYVDHMVDAFGSIALMVGLGASELVHWGVALAMLIAFLLLAAESYLATYTLHTFELSQGWFGPTEIRLLLIAGNVALLHNPFCTVFGQRLLLFDLGGSIAAAGMFAMCVVVTLRHTAQLRQQEAR
jgi:phosphatidylglycerophosphate synthase